MAEIAANVWKWLGMNVNGWDCLKVLEMAEICLKWLETTWNSCELLTVA